MLERMHGDKSYQTVQPIACIKGVPQLLWRFPVFFNRRCLVRAGLRLHLTWLVALSRVLKLQGLACMHWMSDIKGHPKRGVQVAPPATTAERWCVAIALRAPLLARPASIHQLRRGWLSRYDLLSRSVRSAEQIGQIRPGDDGLKPQPSNSSRLLTIQPSACKLYKQLMTFRLFAPTCPHLSPGCIADDKIECHPNSSMNCTLSFNSSSARCNFDNHFKF